MTYEEFIAAAREVKEHDRNLGRQLRDLYLREGGSHGTLLQFVSIVLAGREHLKEAALQQQLLSEESIRMAIGTRGQVDGIDYVLRSLHKLMTDEPEENEDAG